MPVYTLNPSHKRSGSHKASSAPSLRERVAARRNPGTAYNIYLDGKLIDVMPYYPHLAHLTLDEMRRKLVSDGYDPRITVKTRKERSKPAARRNPLSEDGVVVSNPATAYNVYLGKKLIDTVFQSGESDADEVRRSLINHDGYDRDIRVVKARSKNPLSEDGVVVSNPGSKFYVAIDDRAGEERTAWSGPFSRKEAEAVAAHEREYWRGQYSVRVVAADKKPKPQPRHFSELPLSPGEEEYYAQRHENPKKRKAGAKKPTKAQAIRVLKAAQARIRARRAKEPRAHAHAGHGAYAAEDFMDNPKKRTKKKAGSKRSGGRTEAQKNAAKAMHLWHSGKASSLAEAWEMVRAGR